MDAVTTQSFVAIASLTILCWDHMITFADEVDLIWCQPKKILGWLFLLNRYITPLGFVVNIIVLTLPNWPTEMTGIKLLLSCRNFVRYQGAMAILGVSIAELIMLMRIRVLYRERRLVVAAAGFLLLVRVALEACLMTLGKIVPYVQQIHSCHEDYDLPLALSVTRAWLPLAYDTAIFVMTLWRTYHRNEISPILPALQSEGILYYIVICSANLVLTVMIVRAPPGLKGVVMTSRVTLHLKKQVRDQQPCSPTVSRFPPGHQQRFFADHDSQLKLPCSTTPIPPIPIKLDPTDDTQTFGSVDVESL
ncbi:uncharacterized protein F5891DRAFT_1003902 [Suillus fuscotomentosus]|uniref:DUF6533 domain-containing protein n=1 Tax=Suillus fuscotomentosus TaxID=1912939 RepID=A0AAD4EKQ7_9AGAM|nr:uncharacterized protein F5891DRAFT_1003902 [Suillus fuscotomentosus]KAG1906798.1 hypothetical protein F5891DRAFT_1003902 [Suillus fuscotomentosus]